jgi:hypothetical protein
MILALIFLCGLSLRTVLFFRLSEVHADEAGSGLMARHILHGEFPIFYWGGDYAGTLEPFITAVSFYVLGSSMATLRLVPSALSLLLMPLTYRLARVTYGEPTARLAMLFAAVPSLMLLYFGGTAKTPYPASQILGPLLLLLALRLADAPGVDRPRALVLGLVAGVAWWNQFLVVSYLLAAGLFLALRRGWTRLLPEAGMATLGFVVGSLPFSVYNLAVQRGQSLGLMRTASPGLVGDNLATITHSLPFLLGGSIAWPIPAVNHVVLSAMVLVYAPAAGFLLYQALRALRSPRRLEAGWLLILAAGTAFLVDLASAQGTVGGPRYLFPLLGVLPVLVANYVMAVRRRLGLGAALVLVVLTVGLHLQELALDLTNVIRPSSLEQQTRPSTAGLERFLRSQGISRAYAHSSVALKLTFDAREEIVASDWYGFRNRSYLDEVERAPQVALVASRALALPPPDRLEENLRALGGGYRRQDVDGFAVFYDFHPPPPSRSIPPVEWAGRSIGLGGDARLAYDRDGETWWGSGEPKRPGLAYELDLGRPHRLTGVSLHPGPVADGAPQGYRVEVSRDQRSWTTAVSVASVLPGLHWTGSQPRLDRSGRVQAAFPPVEARWVRLVQTGREDYFWWSIGELFLYEDAPGSTVESPGRDALENGQRLERRAGWEFVGASPVAATQWRHQRDVDWDGIVAAYRRAIRVDPELEEAHHRLAVVLSRLEIPPPGDPGRAPALERAGAWRLAAEEYDAALRRSPDRSAPWEARLRVARMTGDTGRAREVEQVLQTRFTPPTRSGMVFGGRLELQGFALDPKPVAPGQLVQLQAYWKALRALDGDYQVRVVFEAAGARFESGRLPLSGGTPQSEWIPGETVKETFAIEVPPGTPPARYEVRLSVKDGRARHPFRVWWLGLPTLSRAVRLGMLEVVPR